MDVKIMKRNQSEFREAVTSPHFFLYSFREKQSDSRGRYFSKSFRTREIQMKAYEVFVLQVYYA